MTRGLSLAIVGLLALAACEDSPPSDAVAALDALPRSEPAAESTTTTTAPWSAERRRCEDDDLATKSLEPTAAMRAGAIPAGGSVEAIRDRGYLVVGVDENTWGFAARDTDTGDIEGFEVDLARAIALRLFGGDDPSHVVTVPVVTDEKLDVVEDGDVDMTISANSMSCRRWEQVAFSAEYYTAHQQFLVRAGSPVDELADLGEATVCVTAGSSSIGLLEDHLPGATPHVVPDRTGCLRALQDGDVDAYLGHDSFLVGMVEQDPNVEIRELLDPTDSVSHYGIAIARDDEELVRFVNAALEDIVADRTWERLHQDLEGRLPGLDPASPPTPQYRPEP